MVTVIKVLMLQVPCWVFNDAIAALASATRGPPHGICVVAGTGSICVGMSGDSFHRASGWGSIIGDAGGGFEIGRKALATVAASVEERQPPTALGGTLARACGASSMAELLQWVYQDTSWACVASLAPAVLACAASGDTTAVSILKQTSAELVESVVVVAGRLEEGSNGEPAPLVLSGGLFSHQEQSIYRSLVEEQLVRRLPQHPIRRCAFISPRPVHVIRGLMRKRARRCRPIVDSATGAALLGAHYLRNGTSDREGAYCHGVIDQLSRNTLLDQSYLLASDLAVARKEE